MRSETGDALEALEIESKRQEEEDALNKRADEIFMDASKFNDVVLSINDTWNRDEPNNDCNLFESLLHDLLTKTELKDIAKARDEMITLYDKHCYEVAQDETD